MRKAQKKQVEDFIGLLAQTHDEIRNFMEKKNYAAAMDLLGLCQEGAMQAGGLIEKTEGESSPVISRLEEYCELIYTVHEELSGNAEVNATRLYKKLRKSLIQVEICVKNDIKIRLEMVFMPYKASMWDSLESVWQAADAASDCDAYVVPLPYYDKNPDGSVGSYHYEGDKMPPYVPVTYYEAYSLEERKPDVIFIHNPYDFMNRVTSVDPRFYSYELKKNTECLVYIPYYTTSGGMSEGQSSCPAYYFADYIIIQAEKYRKFFDPEIPKEKFVPLGSPKFDRVMRLCKEPPETPVEWKEKMAGKKVYFYNTSLNGMLADTEDFLKKMEYVFRTFRGRQDSCLLWRPHPLMESTFDSMRAAYRPFYDALKKAFVEENIGILDETADIEKTIAFSDVYIGDAGTSVISLFGVVGKPIFILNNRIHTKPGKDDWRGEKLNFMFDMYGNDRYFIARNDQLWFSEKNDYHYKFYMDLNIGYHGGGYYIRAVEIKDKIYILPGNARNLLIIKDKKIKKIDFKEQNIYPGAFSSYWYNEKYLFLYPNRYPQFIRLDLEKEEICYIEDVKSFNVRNINGEWMTGGKNLYGNEMVFASPEDDQFLFMDIDTLEKRTISGNLSCNSGIQGVMPEGEYLWLLPFKGKEIIRWNPETGEVRKYNDFPEKFQSINETDRHSCDERLFGNIVFAKEKNKGKTIISPCWGNMFLSLDQKTGKMEEWKTPIRFRNRGKNEYFPAGGMGGFVATLLHNGSANRRIWYTPERRLFEVDIHTGAYREIEIEFDYEELKEHEAGFAEMSENLQYCLMEDAFNSLENFLDNSITGNPFDRKRQMKAFSQINAGQNGTCGEDIFRFVAEKSGAVRREVI